MKNIQRRGCQLQLTGLHGRNLRKGRWEYGGIEKSRKYGRGWEDVLSIGASAEYKTTVCDMMEVREKGALKRKIDEEEHLKIYGGLREGIGMKTYLHGPMDAAKNLKLRFRVGDLDLPREE